MIHGITTVKGSVESNVYCKSNLKAIEKAYKKMLNEFDPTITRTKAVYTVDFMGGCYGAVFGYKKGARKPFVANAFSHTGHHNETIIMICAHKRDYLIEDALDIMAGNREMEVTKIESIEFVNLELA